MGGGRYISEEVKAVGERFNRNDPINILKISLDSVFL